MKKINSIKSNWLINLTKIKLNSCNNEKIKLNKIN